MKRSLFKTIFLALLISIASTPCSAQYNEDEANGVELGVKAGLNLSELYTSDTSISDLIPGFNAGVYIKMPLAKFIAIQSEFYLSSKGSSIRYVDPFLSGTARFDLTYLELPLLCEINVSRHISVELGPYISYMVGAKASNMGNVNLFDFEKNIDAHHFNRLDAGLILGAGLVVHTVTVGVRYTYGFAKVGTTQSFLGTSYTIPNATNGVVSFNLTIPLNKMIKDPITNKYSL